MTNPTLSGFPMAQILQLIQEIITWSHKQPAWVAYVIVLYGFLLFAKRFGMSFGPITILLAPFFYIPFYFFAEGNSPWIVRGLWLLLQSVTGLCFISLRAIENGLLQDRRDRRAKALEQELVQGSAQGKVPAYSLYLRPFDSTNRLATQATLVSPGTLLMRSGAPEHIDLETVLRSALHPRELLIALGKPGEMLGAGRIASLDTEWQTKIDNLAEHARSLLVYPSNHGGTLWEIKRLQEKHWLSKTIWIMPQTCMTELGLPAHDFAPDWNQTIQALKERGIELPPYEENGLLFMLDQQGQVCASLPLDYSWSVFRVGSMRKGLRLLKNPAKRAKLKPHSRRENQSVVILKRSWLPLLFGVVFFGFITYGSLYVGNLLFALFGVVVGIIWIVAWFQSDK